MRRLLVAIGVFIVLAGVAAVATPWLLSSDIVKREITSRIEELTGLKTTLKGDPKLSLIPFLGIKLKDVVIASPPGIDPLYKDQPLVTMEALKGRLRFLPAIFGQAELADFKMIRPLFNITVTRRGKANWRSKRGVLGDLLSAGSSQEGSNGYQPAEPTRLGDFEIINGVVRYQNDQLGRTAEITSLNMLIAWPDTANTVSYAGSMVWSGEVVEVSGRVDEPVKMLTGGKSGLTIDLKSSPLSTHFEGVADYQPEPLFSGDVEISSTSLRQFLAWTGYSLSPGSTPGELKLSSSIIATPSWIKFQNATISLDGNTGTGFIDMSVSETNRISFGGTLAYSDLNLDPYIQALEPGKGIDKKEPEIAKIELINEFDFDLRFSADTAILGDLAMSSMAATAQLKDGNIIVDVGEASIFGGTLQAQLQAREEEGAPSGELKLNLNDIELGDFSRFVSPVGMTLFGKGSASIALSSRGRNMSQIMQRLNGAMSLEAAEGRIEGINLAAIARDGSNTIIIDASKVLASTTEFNDLAIGMHIANGIAFFEETNLRGDRIHAKLGGKADLWRRSLAMNGRVVLFKSAATTSDDKENIMLDIPFFVGGTVRSPLFAPDFLSPRRTMQLEKEPAKNTSPPSQGIPDKALN